MITCEIEDNRHFAQIANIGSVQVADALISGETLEFLMEHCLDKENDGVFWSLTYDAQVLDSTKHTYNQAFAIYALSAYYRLTGKQEALDTAFSLFRRIEETCRDEVGYLEAFTRDWRPESNEKLSENGVLADKTMNTLPIFTLGASTSAAFAVAGKMAAKEDHFVWKGFFTAFRTDFDQSSQ